MIYRILGYFAQQSVANSILTSQDNLSKKCFEQPWKHEERHHCLVPLTVKRCGPVRVHPHMNCALHNYNT